MKYNILLFMILGLALSCTKPKARKPVVQKTSSFLKESIERNKAINKNEEKAFLELMKADTINNYISSENGFWYFYNTKNSIQTPLPKTGDEVTYTYEIKNIDGTAIYTEEELGERKYLIDKQELITGLQDGLKLLQKGETVTFLFPSHKAYGYSGYKKIKSNQPLIYTVSLKNLSAEN